MSKRKIYFPAELVGQLGIIVQQEQYVALNKVFAKHGPGEMEYLELDQSDALNLLKIADIEMQKAILKYPNNEDDMPDYDPEHEEQYDDVMMGVYEKTYYYVRAEFPDIKLKE